MPMFEYTCRQCNERFETIVTASRPAACPKCDSADLEKMLSVFAVGGAQSSQRELPAACQSCPNPRGPAGCGVN